MILLGGDVIGLFERVGSNGDEMLFFRMTCFIRIYVGDQILELYLF